MVISFNIYWGLRLLEVFEIGDCQSSRVNPASVGKERCKEFIMLVAEVLVGKLKGITKNTVAGFQL